MREICLSFQHTSEGIKYGDQLCFMVMGKVFCSSNIKNLDKVNFKVSDEIFDEFCDREGVVPAPYGGAKFKWVQITSFEVLSDKEWFDYLNKAYGLVRAKLPKKAFLNKEE